MRLLVTIPPCEVRLAPGRFYGVVSTGLDMGPEVLTDRDLDKILASNEPIDPLEKRTRTIHNGHIKDFFEEAKSDETIRAKWPETVTYPVPFGDATHPQREPGTV